MEWIENLKMVGVVVSAGGALGTFLAWMYKKTVAEPNQRAYEKMQMEYTNAMKDALTPLTYQIKSLNDTLMESKEDRAKLHLMIEFQDDVLSAHETRITVLEKTGGK